MRPWLPALFAVLVLAAPAAAQNPCQAVGEPLPRADCDRIDALQGRVQAALTRFHAPEPMAPGERAELTLEVRPANPPTAPGALAAELAGDGFVVSPQGVRSQDLSPDKRARWTWQVTAPASGPRFLTLTTSLKARLPDGRLVTVSSSTRSQRIVIGRGPEPQPGWLGRLKALPAPVRLGLVVLLGLAALLLARWAVRALLARRA